MLRGTARIWRAAGQLLLLMLAASGCGNVQLQKLSQQEVTNLRASGQTVILYRIDVSEDGTPVDPTRPSFSNWNAAPIHMRPVEIRDKIDFVPIIQELSLSEQTRAQGWRYLVLNPGRYTLNMNSRFGGNWSNGWRDANGPASIPAYFIDVPSGVPILYAGSYRLQCFRNWSGSGESACSYDLAPGFEMAEARRIARAAFPGLGVLQQAEIRRYGAALPRGVVKDARPFFVHEADITESATPDWEGRALQSAFGWVGALGQGVCSNPYACFGALLIGAAYAPIGLAISSLESEADKKQYGPCVKRISDEFQSAKPGRLLAKTVAVRAAERGIPVSVDETVDKTIISQSGTRLVLRILSLNFKDCKKEDRFCLEIVVRAWLDEPVSKRRLYDTIFTYSNGEIDTNFDRMLKAQHLVQDRSPCLGFERFCEGETQTVFREQMLRGFNAIADALLPPNARDR